MVSLASHIHVARPPRPSEPQSCTQRVSLRRTSICPVNSAGSEEQTSSMVRFQGTALELKQYKRNVGFGKTLKRELYTEL